jgi:hypothetical protein
VVTFEWDVEKLSVVGYWFSVERDEEGKERSSGRGSDAALT